jgi:hypothetical protein
MALAYQTIADFNNYTVTILNYTKDTLQLKISVKLGTVLCWYYVLKCSRFKRRDVIPKRNFTAVIIVSGVKRFGKEKGLYRKLVR